MVKYYLFKTEVSKEKDALISFLTTLNKGEFDIFDIDFKRGYIKTSIDLNQILSPLIPTLTADLGFKITFIYSHNVKEIALRALDYAFSRSVTYANLADVVLEMIVNGNEDIKKLITAEFSNLAHDLYLTARAYINMGLNAVAAANAIYVHRNTFNYRLNKFISLTGLDIRDFWNATYFNIYLRLQEKN